MKLSADEAPQYLLIKAQLQEKIQNGSLKCGDKLPRNANFVPFSIPLVSLFAKVWHS